LQEKAASNLRQYYGGKGGGDCTDTSGHSALWGGANKPILTHVIAKASIE
jgi:hypothetical protein